MRILSWHGYLLRGSGSNIYNANTASAWRAAGHDVLLMCQERAVSGLGFVDAHGDFSPGNAGFRTVDTGEAPAAGRCRVVRPAIGEILPVYVYDEYPGFVAKRFVDLTDGELELYVDANVAALATAIRTFRPDAILVGHEVMGPYIAKRACAAAGPGFLAKLHGSALEYAVKVQSRYLTYATQGLSAAAVVVGGSRYIVSEASRLIPGLEARAVVVNPGCDVERFRPAPTPPHVPTVGFVGKLIAPKGVHNLLGALGLTTTPGLSVTIVGYGGSEPVLRALSEALSAGDRDAAVHVAGSGEDHPFVELARTLEDAPDGYFARAAGVPVTFTGRLEHGPLSRLLPTFDVLVVPSVLAEAFGMVAAEAAACGVLPVVPRHSGIGEVGSILEKEMGRPGLLTFDPRDPLGGIAGRIDHILGLEPAERARLGATAARVARARWSWGDVASRLLSHALTAAGERGPSLD